MYSLFIHYMLWSDLVLGTPASEHGKDVDNLMAISMALIFFVQTITQFLLHYFLFFKYREKEGQKSIIFCR